MRKSTVTSGGRMLRAVGTHVGGGDLNGAGRAAKPTRVVVVSSPTATSPPGSPPWTSASARGWCSLPWFADGEDWERGDSGAADEIGVSERYVFETEPSKEEAEEAVSALQRFLVPVTLPQVAEDGSPISVQGVVEKEIISIDEFERGCSAEFSTESESDWIEPAMHLFSSNSSQSKQCEKVYDAFNLLKISPSIQRMVVSLSSDKAIWDAVMKNEAVQELKKCFCEVRDDGTASADGDPDIAIGSLRWILHSTKAKVREFIDHITRLMNEIFHSQGTDDKTDFFNDAVRSSFMLSVMVFIVVVVIRIQRS
ncbi:unnamed protein product [Musa hybrid cultivar]